MKNKIFYIRKSFSPIGGVLFWTVLLNLCLSPLAFSQQKKQSKVACDVELRNNDFNDGTYIIKNPGTYCLAEDISFNPNNAAYLRGTLQDPTITAYEASMPLPSQLGFGPGQYDPSAFGLGFFAAIAVAAPDVTLDLQGFEIQQSEEHALLQRFFAVIETADRPFIQGQGPHDFGTVVGSAQNLTIRNGTIGKSAHHGIHGNRTKDLTVEDVEFVDFEVAAVAMNGVDGLTLKNLTATSRNDVPVLGQYSTAQFIKAYVNYLVSSGSSVMFNGMSATQVQSDLKAAINNVHEDLIQLNKKEIVKRQHPSEWALFHNAAGVVDGNAYGFLINGVGVAVNGFPTLQTADAQSKNIFIENVTINRLEANIREILTVISNPRLKAPSIDPVGSVFQLMALDPDGNPLAMTEASSNGIYVGNAVTNAQGLVAKASHLGEFPSFLNTSRNSISPALVRWAESGNILDEYLQDHLGLNGSGFLCNGDQMFHVNKGVIGFKIDGANTVQVLNSSMTKLSNTGQVGSELCGNYSQSHPSATLQGYGGAITRGMSISGSENVEISSVNIKNLKSSHGTTIGIDIQTDSKQVTLLDIETKILFASSHVGSLPMESQKAVGLRVSGSANNIVSTNFCAKNLKAYLDQISEVLDNSASATIVGGCK